VLTNQNVPQTQERKPFIELQAKVNAAYQQNPMSPLNRGNKEVILNLTGRPALGGTGGGLQYYVTHTLDSKRTESSNRLNHNTSANRSVSKTKSSPRSVLAVPPVHEPHIK
jgi:hypothetical protein